MFNRLAAARIKAAQDALAAGRLDEALEIAVAPDLTDLRKIRHLLEQLAPAFLKRGQDRLLGRQFRNAMEDFDNAARCGAENAVIDEWRDRAMKAMQYDQRAQADKHAALAEAKQRLAAGSIVGAEDALAKSPAPDGEEAVMAGQIQRQQHRAENALEAAKQALNDGQLETAVQHLRTARIGHAKLSGLSETEAQVVERIVGKSAESFNAGRLDRAEQELAALVDLGRGNSKRIEMNEALRLGREAAKATAEDRYPKAAVLLGRIEQIGLRAEWVKSAREHLDAIEDRRRALLEGPLGLLMGHRMPGEIQPQPDADETMARPAIPDPPPVVTGVARNVAAVDGHLPRRLILRIDGVGSFLLLRGDRISIGRSGPGATADLELLSDLSERQAEIIRAGEDYFLMSSSGVELAGRPAQHALLQDGDRIRFGARVKLKFLRPSLKSPTAVLDLCEGVRTTSDCRRVILWEGPLLLGGTRECHVPIRGAITGAILIERSGRFLLRPMGLAGQTTPIALGVQTTLGDIRLSVQEAVRGSGPGKVIG